MDDIPYWPTEEDPPRMKAGLPANLVLPPSSQGAGKFTDLPFGSWLYRPVTTVASPSGTVAAWSKEMFGGICRTRSGGAARMC